MTMPNSYWSDPRRELEGTIRCSFVDGDDRQCVYGWSPPATAEIRRGDVDVPVHSHRFETPNGGTDWVAVPADKASPVDKVSPADKASPVDKVSPAEAMTQGLEYFATANPFAKPMSTPPYTEVTVSWNGSQLFMHNDNEPGHMGNKLAAVAVDSETAQHLAHLCAEPKWPDSLALAEIEQLKARSATAKWDRSRLERLLADTTRQRDNAREALRSLQHENKRQGEAIGALNVRSSARFRELGKALDVDISGQTWDNLLQRVKQQRTERNEWARRADKAEASLRDNQSLLNEADRDEADPVAELRGMISDLSADVGNNFARRCSALLDGVRCVQPIHHHGAHHTGRGSEQW